MVDFYRKRVSSTVPQVRAVKSPTWTEWTISTPREDRDHDVVLPNRGGWNLDGWVACGCPFMLDHGVNDSQPIGTGIEPESGKPWIQFGPDGVVARCWHDTSTQVGRDALALVDAGILRTASISFVPDPARMRRRTDRPKGSIISGLDRIEISLTSTPSNVQCVRTKSSRPAPPVLRVKSVAGLRLLDAALTRQDLVRLRQDVEALKRERARQDEFDAKASLAYGWLRRL
jgi:hypothetical protein